MNNLTGGITPFLYDSWAPVSVGQTVKITSVIIIMEVASKRINVSLPTEYAEWNNGAQVTIDWGGYEAAAVC